MMQSMADRRSRELLVRLRHVEERGAAARVDAARREVEAREQAVASEAEKARLAAQRVERAGSGVDAKTAGRMTLREKLRGELRAEQNRLETRRKWAAQIWSRAAQAYEAAQDDLAQAHRARAAAERALSAADQAERRRVERRSERALEDSHGRKPPRR
jgi:hypothetical protein